MKENEDKLILNPILFHFTIGSLLTLGFHLFLSISFSFPFNLSPESIQGAIEGSMG